MTAKITKKVTEKKVDEKGVLRASIVDAVVGSTAFDGITGVVAKLSDSEILFRGADHDVVLKVVVKKERLDIEFEGEDEDAQA